MKSTTSNVMPFRPTRYTQQRLVASIIDGTYSAGSVLPSERKLAEEFGVTRPTIREVLQRLAGEGWVTIRHGKATEVNNYWETGGLGLLGTIVQYSDHLPDKLILHLLEFRVNFLPQVARLCFDNNPEPILHHLRTHHNLTETPGELAEFDWHLQILMTRHGGNPIYPLILNDFKALFTTMALSYFGHEVSRKASIKYYQYLEHALDTRESDIEKIVRQAMIDSVEIWKQINPER